MTQIHAYLNFNGNTREAMTFYHSCLGGELDLQVVEGSPFESQLPPSMKHQIYHATLVKDAILLMASDMIGPGGFKQGNTVSLSVSCSSEAEITTFFEKLSLGGKIAHPLDEMFWGAIFGTFTDQFGVQWMLNYDKKGIDS